MSEPPIFLETAQALNFHPELPSRGEVLEQVARIHDVPAELLEPPSAKRYRRPWLGVEAYDATQVLPVVPDGA